MTLVDTHCHLDLHAFNRDRQEVLLRAQQAGLIRILIPGIDLQNCQSVLQLCDAHTEVYGAVGIHPNSAMTWNTQTLSTLRILVQHPKVVAIGEIGLDFYRDQAPKEIQLQIFREQLQLAGEYGLPVIVHSRQAESETLDILSEWAVTRPKDSPPPGVLHSYSGDEPTAKRAITLEFFLGITGPVTFRNAVQLHELVTALPLTNLLIETDAPFLTPHPHRGDRNEPAFVRHVAEKIASLKNLPLEQVSEITTANAAQLFQWSSV
jgi:TatD DNase family protein